jgi:hypothetical protein
MRLLFALTTIEGDLPLVALLISKPMKAGV